MSSVLGPQRFEVIVDREKFERDLVRLYRSLPVHRYTRLAFNGCVCMCVCVCICVPEL